MSCPQTSISGRSAGVVPFARNQRVILAHPPHRLGALLAAILSVVMPHEEMSVRSVLRG
jgi:hypothetical protein